MRARLPVLLEGEDIADYEAMLARVTTAVVPEDIIEEFWVRDVVDLVWEALRLRRLKAALLVSSTAAGLREVLSRSSNSGSSIHLIQA